MNSRIAVGASLALVLLIGGAMTAETLKSGPQVGERVATPFNPLHANGPNVDQRVCLV
jgi:hypothetical protein